MDTLTVSAREIVNVDRTFLTPVDTLHFTQPGKENPRFEKLRWVGIGVSVLSGSMVVYFHDQAEDSYREYLHSGNPADLKQLFDQTAHYDRLTGWSYAGLQVGLMLFALSFY